MRENILLISTPMRVQVLPDHLPAGDPKLKPEGLLLSAMLLDVNKSTTGWFRLAPSCRETTKHYSRQKRCVICSYIYTYDAYDHARGSFLKIVNKTTFLYVYVRFIDKIESDFLRTLANRLQVFMQYE